MVASCKDTEFGVSQLLRCEVYSVKHMRRTWLLNAESLSFFPKVSSPFWTISFRSGMVSCPRANRAVPLFLARVCNRAALDVTLTTKQTLWQGKKNKRFTVADKRLKRSTINKVISVYKCRWAARDISNSDPVTIPREIGKKNVLIWNKCIWWCYECVLSAPHYNKCVFALCFVSMKLTCGSCCGIQSEPSWPLQSRTRSTPSTSSTRGFFFFTSIKLEWNSDSKSL